MLLLSLLLPILLSLHTKKKKMNEKLIKIYVSDIIVMYVTFSKSEPKLAILESAILYSFCFCIFFFSLVKKMMVVCLFGDVCPVLFKGFPKWELFFWAKMAYFFSSLLKKYLHRIYTTTQKKRKSQTTIKQTNNKRKEK